MHRDEVFSYACRKQAPLPAEMLDASSTPHELYGIYIFSLAAAAYLARGRYQVIMDNFGCVFIMGGMMRRHRDSLCDGWQAMG